MKSPYVFQSVMESVDETPIKEQAQNIMNEEVIYLNDSNMSKGKTRRT